MKRFQFRLESVLLYRRQLEELALVDFQKALSNERDAEDKLIRMRDSLNDLCRAGMNGEDGSVRMHRDEFKRQLFTLIEVQTRLLTELKGITKEKRERYLESRKETRILERLRDKAWLEYQKSVDKVEQQEMDDLFLMKRKEMEIMERVT